LEEVKIVVLCSVTVAYLIASWEFLHASTLRRNISDIDHFWATFRLFQPRTQKWFWTWFRESAALCKKSILRECSITWPATA